MSDDYMYPYVEEEGSLHIPTSNRAGKKFQTWAFKPVNGKRFEIEINLLYPAKDKPLRFSASSSHLTQSYESSDIEELRKMVDADLKSTCRALNSIEWEEWYQVVVSSGYRDGDNESTMTIKYGKLKRGIDPVSGAAVTIHNNRVVLPFPDSKKSGEKEGGLYSGFSDSDEVSYIPVTDRNTAALELLVKKLSMLRAEIASFLTQDNIQEAIDINLQHKLISHS